MTQGLDGHVLARPCWDCAACGEPWPCDPAREALAASMGRGTALTIYMHAYFQEAAAQEPPVGPVGELYDRFLAWARAPTNSGP